MLKVKNIHFSYDEVPVLTDISLEVEPGKLVAIFGPNGHGKSTLLKAITGLIRPRSGTISYNERLINGLSTEEIINMGLVYIAEDRHLFPDMTVNENLKLGAYCKRARPKEKGNLEYVYHLFPKLKKLGKQRASSLSGGEARMLAIGRGLMSNPQFLAIDEPSFGLAPKLRIEVFHAIQDIKEKGSTILLVEQSTTIAYEFADWVYVLEDGKIVFEGAKESAMLNQHILQVYLGVV